jgi:drug/metabolite transporter (DMT)-like permease
MQRLLSTAPLLIYIAIWVVMGEVIQGLLVGWAKPWALTYCIKSGFSLTLLPYALLRRLRLSRASPPALPLPERSLLWVSFCLAPVSTVCTLTWYLSLPGTSFAGNAAVYQAATPFALLFSVLLLGETLTLRKLACMVCALVGVALVTFGGSSGGTGPKDTLSGYAWVVCSTVLYALYEVLYSRLTQPAASKAPLAAGAEEQEEGQLEPHAGQALLQPEPAAAAAAAGSAAVAALLKAETAALVLGGIGLATLLTQWPLFFLANATGLEAFQLPSLDKGKLVALTMVLDSIYNFSLLWGVSASTAFSMQLASTLVVPAGILADWALHHKLPSAQAVCGALLVIAAVLALGAPPGAPRALLKWLCAWRRAPTQAS